MTRPQDGSAASAAGYKSPQADSPTEATGIRRRGPVALAAVLAALAVLGGAQAGSGGSGPAVDAGVTHVVADENAPVRGEVHGIDDPSLTWTLHVDGEDRGSARFADPHSLETTLNVTGLAGDVTLRLEARDPSTGDTHSDTVVYHVGDGGVLLDAKARTGVGVPDEIVGASGTDRQTRRFPFQVPADAGSIQATLDWTNELAAPILGNDFDLYLVDPDGNVATGTQGATLSKPERVRVGDPQPGQWTARVEGYLHTPDTVHVTATSRPGTPAPVPDPRIGGPYHFGADDPQRLFSRTPTDASLDRLAWDLDGDGHAEATGSTAQADLPQGTHQVVLEARESQRGYEAEARTTVAVDPAVDHAYDLNCGGSFWQPNWTMEYAAGKGTCWWHNGHHTYFLNGTYTLAGGSGRVFSVEQQLAPPRRPSLAVDGPASGPGVDADAPIQIEVSLHGRSWTQVGVASYDLAAAGAAGLSAPIRQRVTFTLESLDRPFRYLRIHQPRSATGGLSGFLDASDLTVRLHDAPAQPKVPAPQGPQTLTCADGDILEDFFRAHPCTYGGANRYDAPSFLHTYPLGAARDVDEVSGRAAVAPWRTDDYALPLLPTPSQATETRLFVQTSRDGIHWTTHARVPVRFGVPTTFTADVDATARFVRLHADYHPLYDQAGSAPSLHHPEGYMLRSRIHVVPSGTP